MAMHHVNYHLLLTLSILLLFTFYEYRLANPGKMIDEDDEDMYLDDDWTWNGDKRLGN